MKNLIARFVREEEGQDLIEYALVATFVSLVASAGATTARRRRWTAGTAQCPQRRLYDAGS